MFSTTAPALSQTAVPLSSDTSSQPRKGLNTDGDPSFTEVITDSTPSRTRVPKPTSFPSGPIPESILAAPSSTSLNVPSHTFDPGRHDRNNNNNKGKDNDNGLSPTAERLLIAVGAIGMLYWATPI